MLGVPLERPVNLGERATLTDEEFARLPSQTRIRNANDAFFGESRDHWRDYGKPQRQTSLIVDPPNGRFPAMTRDGAKRTAAIPNEARGSLNGPENASPFMRRAPFRSPEWHKIALYPIDAFQGLPGVERVEARPDGAHAMSR